MMTEKEKALLASCVNGEKAAWDAFVLQYSGLVYHTIKKTFTLYHTEPRPDLVEDLFQEFFLSLLHDDFKKLRQFRGDRGCSLASWLRVAAARLTIDYLRKQGPSKVELAATLPHDQPDPSNSLIDEEQERSLSQILQALPSRDRLFIDLYFRQSLAPEEIASMLRVSVSAVYTQKSRILDKLREILQKNSP
ncbi:MAG: sigma-70 family RNA polymerase sigma factor [Deltaproteobacteria bacterium]|nr:sigma-70 family RNA polymerase sigma factor [Deltaproteobacteria bacterium]